MNEWLPMNPYTPDCTHLWEFKPDPGLGGTFLSDVEGRLWSIRRCVLCEHIQGREVEDE